MKIKNSWNETYVKILGLVLMTSSGVLLLGLGFYLLIKLYLKSF